MRGEPATKLNALESIRGIAALLVITYHVAYQRQTVFPPEADPLLAPLGLYSLPMFFVLSAFVLWYGYVGDGGRMRHGVRHFYRRRFFRIAPLFYLLLAVHLLFIFDFTQVRHLVWSSLFFVFNLVPGHRVGLVLAGWSIGVEVIYYAVLPLVALLVRNAFTAVLLFAGMTAVAFDAGRDIVGMKRMAEIREWDTHQIDAYASFQFNGLFFAAGIVAVFAFAHMSKATPEVQRRVGRLVLGASVLAMVGLAWACANAPFAHRWAWAVALAALVFGLATAPPRFMLHRSVRWAGARSYSIYLIHGVVILALERAGFTAWADQSMGWLGFVVCVLLAVVVTLSLAAVTYRLVELPGMRAGGSGAVVDPHKQKVLTS